MITYKDIYDAAKRNPLVSFQLPQSSESQNLLVASEGFWDAPSGGFDDNI